MLLHDALKPLSAIFCHSLGARDLLNVARYLFVPSKRRQRPFGKAYATFSAHWCSVKKVAGNVQKVPGAYLKSGGLLGSIGCNERRLSPVGDEGDCIC